MLLPRSLISRFPSSTKLLAEINSFDICRCRPQSRNVWKFTHHYMPERTPEGQSQRPPTEHPDFTKYSSAEFEEQYNNPAPPFKIILLEDIKEFGEKFDIVEVEAEAGRRAILAKKASYASPFDLEYYGRKKKEWLASGQGQQVKIPRDLIKFGQELANKVITVLVSLTNQWELSVEMLASSLQESGLNVPIESIHLAGEPLTGPNLSEDGRLFRFYIIIDDQMIVPMLGRLTHISTDEANLFPMDEKFQKAPTDRQHLAQFGIRPETLYFTMDGVAKALEERNVGEFMGARDRDAVTGIN